MQNVEFEVEGDQLVIRVDLSQELGVSSSGKSVIIATTSEQATEPSSQIFDYAMTKAATTSYVRSLAKQLAEKGIRVNGVAPGPIWTPLQVSGGATMTS